MKRSNLKIVTMVGVIAVAFTSVQAQARCSSGFIANLLCENGIVDQQTANRADRVHALSGNPLDRVPGAVLTYIHPAAGAAYEANQQYIKQKDRFRMPSNNGARRVFTSQPPRHFQPNTGFSFNNPNAGPKPFGQFFGFAPTPVFRSTTKTWFSVRFKN